MGRQQRNTQNIWNKICNRYLAESNQVVTGRQPSGGYTFLKVMVSDAHWVCLIVQRAVVMVLEPVYEQIFSSCSFGFRPGRSAHQALQYLRNHIMDEGGRWILDIDIRKYDVVE